MATFFDKNKKKSALAALLFFIKTRKTVTTLLLLMALAMFMFVGPSNLLLALPGGTRMAAGMAWIAGKMGIDTSKWGLAGGKRDYGDLLAAFRAAKDGGGKAGWGAFMSGGAGGRGGVGAGSGSLDFVKGNAKDLEVKGGNGEKLAKPGSVDGVLNPDDAKNRGEGEGVALSEGDVSGEGGVVKTAFAGGFGSGSQLSGGAFASGGFFGNGSSKSGTAGSASTPKLGDLVKGGLAGIGGQNGKGVPIKGGAVGKLSAVKSAAISARSAKGISGTRTISGQRAFVQLAAGRGRAAISVSPNCTAESGCPAEFAATNTGAVYDGNVISGTRTDILTAPAIDDIGNIDTPNIPETPIADDYVNDAEQMLADAQKCRELDDLYGPQEKLYDQRQQIMQDQFAAMGCGEGGCNKKKARDCKRKGNDMIALCKEAMTLRCKHIHECPLTKDNNCSPDECDGPARDKIKYTDVNGGIRSTTKDMGETDAGCPAAKQDLPHKRQAAQNAIKTYRDLNCVALYSSPAYSDQVKYLHTCSGPGTQVVNTCIIYGITLCQGDHDCADHSCRDAKYDCKIEEVDAIEEFILKEAAYH